jgi:hypothetical protein
VANVFCLVLIYYFLRFKLNYNVDKTNNENCHFIHFVGTSPAPSQAVKFQLENCSWGNYSLKNNNKSWIIYLKCTQLSIAHFLQQCFPIFLEIKTVSAIAMLHTLWRKLFIKDLIRFMKNDFIWTYFRRKKNRNRFYETRIYLMKVEYHFDFDFQFPIDNWKDSFLRKIK